MRGYQIVFHTRQDQKLGSGTVADWLLEQVKALKGGATLLAAKEGLGRDHKIHSAGFFELSDQPIQVQMALSEQDAERLFANIKAAGLRIFYIKTPIEYGVTGEEE